MTTLRKIGESFTVTLEIPDSPDKREKSIKKFGSPNISVCFLR